MSEPNDAVVPAAAGAEGFPIDVSIPTAEPIEPPPPEPIAEPIVEPSVEEEPSLVEEPVVIEDGFVDILYPKGARIRIDGTWIKGRVPLLKYRLPPGEHRVMVSKGRRRTYKFTVKENERTRLDRSWFRNADRRR